MLVILHKVKELKALLISVLLSFSIFTVSYTQTSDSTNYLAVTLKGVIIDSVTQTLLSEVNISVLELDKKQLFRNISTNDSGSFEVRVFPGKKYQVSFSLIGYKPKVLNLSIISNPPVINIGLITLTSVIKELKEVQVVSQKPIIEQDIDKIIYNVDEDPESNTSTAFDMLRKMPMLSVDADDNLQLNGNSSYRILINGKPSTLFSNNQSDIFKNMPANAMKTVEIITVPSSRFEGEGVGGIINIITYKKTIGGYTGGISLRASQPRGYSANGNITATLGKLSFSGNYGYNGSVSPTNSNLFYRQDKIQLNQLKQQGNSNSKSGAQNWSGQLSWELSSLDLVTLSYSRSKTKGNNKFHQLATLLNNADIPVEAYNNINAGDQSSLGSDFSFDYQHSFKKNEDQQLNFSCRKSNSITSSNSDYTLQPIINYKQQSSITNNDDAFKEQSFQLNYLQPLKKNSLEFGINSLRRKNSSAYYYKNWDSLSHLFIVDSNQSNNYHFDEIINAAYASLSLKMGKWGMRLGARLEDAKADARFVSSSNKIRQQYMNLMPNVLLSRQLNGVSMIKLSYAQRIQRPDLNYLDPYIDLTDPYNISFGNPHLQPALTHVFNLSYNAIINRTTIAINAANQFTNNSIQQFTVLGTDTVSRTTYGNIGQNKKYSLSFTGNTTFFRRLGMTINGGASYVKYSTFINNKTHSSEGFTYNVSTFINLRIKEWRAGCNISYNSPNILLQGRSSSYIANSFAINKYFLKDKSINVGLSIVSPFQQYRRYFTETSGPSFYQVQQSINTIRRFSLSFNYRFSKVQAVSKEL